MSNVVSLFKNEETFETITYRTNAWKLNSHQNNWKDHSNLSDDVDGFTSPDFRIIGAHNRGTEPHYTVKFTVHVENRQSNETFKLNRVDVISLRDMFAAAAQTMCEEKEV